MAGAMRVRVVRAMWTCALWADNPWRRRELFLARKQSGCAVPQSGDPSHPPPASAAQASLQASAQASPLTLAATQQLRAFANLPADPRALEGALRLLAKWRSTVVGNSIAKLAGPLVQNGPFKGMDYSVAAAEGARAARLLGAYEASLHGVIETAVKRGYKQVVDVGCAEGYYAVGMARRLPKARVWARDASVEAQDLCRENARRNGVADRVLVGGTFGHADFDLCLKKRSLVICDIEGAEDDLMDPRARAGAGRGRCAGGMSRRHGAGCHQPHCRAL